MNLPLAEILDGVKPGQLGALAFGGLVVMAVWMKMNAFEKAFAERMKLLMQASNQPEKREISPQPLIVKKEEQYTTRESFHKHAELNRKAHEDLESLIRGEVKDLSMSHNELAREVSALTSTVEVNSARLVEINSKLDLIIQQRNS